MRRRILIIAIFLALGAVLSFAGGWAGVLWRVFFVRQYLIADEGTSQLGPWPVPVPDAWPRPDSLSVARGWAYERRVASAVTGFPGVEERVRRAVALEEWRAEIDRLNGLGISDPARLPAPPAFAPFDVFSFSSFRRRSGWPLRCMESRWRALEVSTPGVPGTSGTLADQFGEGWTARMYYERGIPWPTFVPTASGSTHFTLPLRPVWPEFAINTVFWAMAAFGFHRAPGVLRARARRRRGLCPNCAYPVGVSSVCTECGRPVRPVPSRTLGA